MFFCKPKNEQLDTQPVVLIDNSGSTGGGILKSEQDYIRKILNEKEIEKAYIIFWNSQANLYKPNPESELTNVCDITTQKTKEHSRGGTNICSGLDEIKLDWFENKKVIDIYIMTDGEINGGDMKLSDSLSRIFWATKEQILNIHIITVEKNTNNYCVDNVSAGNRLFETLSKNFLTKYIRSFKCFNGFHVDIPFDNFYNPIIEKGQTFFGERLFNLTDMDKFNLYLIEQISNVKSEYESTILIHKTIKPVFDHINSILTTDAKQEFKEIIVNNIVGNYISLINNNSPKTIEIQNVLIRFRQLMNQRFDISMKNTTTFGSYTQRREKLFETTNLNLYENTLKTISQIPQKTYISFPIKREDINEYLLIETANPDGDLQIERHNFKNSVIKIGKYCLPLLPTEIQHNHHTNQAIRQWIRHIYSKIWGLNAGDDVILYSFLGECVKIQMSDDIKPEVKEYFYNLTYIMLDRNRYGSGGVKEIDFIKSNLPESVSESQDIVQILKKSADLVGFKNIQPYTYWMLCVCYLKNSYILQKQFELLEEKNLIIQDSMDKFELYSTDVHDFDVRFLNFLKNKVKNDLPKINYIFDKRGSKFLVESEYIDYITFESTIESGGYRIPNHDFGNCKCSPPYTLAKDTMNIMSDTFKCPHCQTLINKSTMVFVPAFSETQKEQNINFEDQIPKDITLTKEYHQLLNDITPIVLTSEIVKRMPAVDKLYTLDQLDLSLKKYKIDRTDALLSKNLQKEYIQIHSIEEFNEEVKKLGFEKLFELEKLGNVVIAGGFIKSIVMRQGIKDIDIFIYGLSTDQEYIDKVRQIIGVLGKAVYAFQKERMNLLQLMISGFPPIQIMFYKHENISSVINYFDIDASMTMYDGHNVYFNSNGKFAYEYLINTFDKKRDNFLYDFRLQKYYKTGFKLLANTKEYVERYEVSKNQNEIEDGYIITDKIKKIFTSRELEDVLESSDCKMTVILDYDKLKKEELIKLMMLNDEAKFVVENGNYDTVKELITRITLNFITRAKLFEKINRKNMEKQSE
jgi:hypothetical protein